MSVPLSDLIPDVLVEVTKCSSVLARKAIQDATIRFFQDSLAYHVVLPEVPISAETAEYDLSNPPGFQILSPRWAEYDRKPLIPTSEEALDLNWSELRRGFNYVYSLNDSGPGVDSENWRYATADRPWLFYCPNPNRIRLVGIPSTVPTVGVTISVYCHPKKGVEQIEDWLYHTWNDVIVLRAIADLKMQKDKTFFDPKGAAVADERYLERVGELANAALRGHQRNNRPNLRVRTWR